MDLTDSPLVERSACAGPSDRFAGASGLLFDQAMAQTRMAVCLTDPSREGNPIIFANRAFFELTGYQADEVIGRNCRFLQGPDTDPESIRRLARAVAQEEVCITEILNYRKDGTPFWNALHLGPIYREDGSLLYYFGSQWNVSDVYAARAEEQHARMLARELSHRVKNMFSVISAVIALTARHERAPWVAEKVNDRIRALGRAYEATLDQAHSRRVVLSDIVGMVLEPYTAGRDRIRISGPKVVLDPNTVSTLGLTLHELVTNSVRHGALSGEGHVSVTWNLWGSGSGSTLVLAWEEEGAPCGPDAPDVRELGSGIVDVLIRGAKGRLDLDVQPGQGLRAIVHLPVSTADLPAEPSGTARPASRSGELAGRRILVLEDEALIALEIETALEEAGASVELAMSAEEALRLLRDARVCAAVLDVNLGRNVTCAPVAERLRSLDTPFVLHSGDLRRHGELVETLAAPVVAKPASTADIIRVLAMQLQGEHAQAAGSPGH